MADSHRRATLLVTAVDELFGTHTRRLVHELCRLGVDPLPSRSTVYRVLVCHNLIGAIPRKRRRQGYRRWERSGPMQWWQLDVMGSVLIRDPSAPDYLLTRLPRR